MIWNILVLILLKKKKIFAEILGCNNKSKTRFGKCETLSVNSG